MLKRTPMPDILLEVGLEEVPARFMGQCLQDVSHGLTSSLQAERLLSDQTTIELMGTYRRFSFIIRNVLEKQTDVDDVLDGPPIQIARSDSGEWLGPAIGFAKKCHVQLDDLIEGENQKGQPIIQAKRFMKGQQTIDLMPMIFERVLMGMKLPIAMHWGANQGPFIRPVKWICSLMETQLISWELFGVTSGKISYGHRFLSPSDDHALGQEILIESPSDYVEKLREAHVMVRVDDRRAMIQTQLMNTLQNIDETLLNEVVHLVEWPNVLSISFPDTFLDLPTDVLVACLKKHQKAFIVTTNNKVRNECLVVADSVTTSNRSTIILGNQRVMMARLNDVQFFWNEDIKTGNFLNWNQTLSTIVFQDGLGSMADKVDRMAQCSTVILNQINANEHTRHVVDRAIACSKADLVSQMVTELPSLQGIMGGFYADAFKEAPEVVVAIRDQYYPRHDGDRLPETLEACVVSMSDRIDTMVACFENNAIPTGSRDPWGIRRSMMAVMKMIIHFKMDVNINELFDAATIALKKKPGETTEKCRSFFMKRMDSVLLDMNLSHDVIQWATCNLLNAPYESVNTAQRIQALKESDPEIYQLLIETTGRVSKIIDGFSQKDAVSVQLFEHPIETIAYESFQQLKEKHHRLILNAETMASTVSFCKTLTEYFELVLVNADNRRVADNRRSFIKSVNDYFFTVGDWLKLQR